MYILCFICIHTKAEDDDDILVQLKFFPCFLGFCGFQVRIKELLSDEKAIFPWLMVMKGGNVVLNIIKLMFMWWHYAGKRQTWVDEEFAWRIEPPTTRSETSSLLWIWCIYKVEDNGFFWDELLNINGVPVHQFPIGFDVFFWLRVLCLCFLFKERVTSQHLAILFSCCGLAIPLWKAVSHQTFDARIHIQKKDILKPGLAGNAVKQVALSIF